ncbi:noncanonical pyrimidine nucleotidase, YjjG family [Hymenobacter busanensis]|uniref:Noncanonical pyrimidine nucleotidase, YjjG family n=1 Tax=Hymenobacter busanensis TaxID=2607656 RepID=A0A7L4ZX95_9BACT|nr:YjjG family noncanonical pyrimidine nucleotidase [Hymenobacter busanensis]KAA9325350.1 noncanonical pyrimidine nucleotidase, YjjG family [Hymenobacter busanensis]QHJ07657.1 noncanonical pyrimidine nucleotidase, YjjG family [Hymenobacter busanensis]
MKYRHLFFDLDHTLWDFEKNADETLRTLFVRHDLARHGTFTVDAFIERYREVNSGLWRLYQSSKIDQQQLRSTRFPRTLAKFGVPEEEVPASISKDFTDLLPQKTAVFPYTHEVLDYLRGKYTLHLITNGFKDIQFVKLASSQLTDYFQEVVTSECSGCLKPDRRIFEHALERTGATAQESLMIGDNLECDVLGAYNAGIDQVYFNPDKRRHNAEVTYEISCLSELKSFL